MPGFVSLVVVVVLVMPVLCNLVVLVVLVVPVLCNFSCTSSVGGAGIV